MIDSAALDLLEGGGKSAKFETVGDTTKGQVVSAESRQQTDYTSGEPLTWDDGNPRMQLVITLATDERDPDDPRHNPPKEYVAAYEAPSRVAGADALLGNTAAPQAPAMAPAGPKLL